MNSNLFHIKLNSSEANLDNGFFTLMTSGTSVTCLKDEEYIITQEALDKLKKERIKYENVSQEGVFLNGGIGKENAPPTKI